LGPAIEEAAECVYTGRYHLLPEQEEQIAPWLRVLGAIDRHVGAAAGPKADKLRKEMRAPSSENHFYSLACRAMRTHRGLPRHLLPRRVPAVEAGDVVPAKKSSPTDGRREVTRAA
jgi:hypothetical protein